MKTSLLIRTIQAAFFLTNIDLSDRIEVANKTKRKLSPLLEGTPTILPIPDDAPLEIPRVVLKSENGKYTCNISANRLDFIHKQSDISKSYEQLWEKFLGNINKLADVIFEELSASSYRLGLVVNYEASFKKGGLDFLKSEVLHSPEDTSQEIQIHKLTTLKTNGFHVNNWLRLISKSEEAKKNPLGIISDVNTLQTEKYKLNKKSVEHFFKVAFELSKDSVSQLLDK
jgi:hypothetical protein